MALPYMLELGHERHSNIIKLAIFFLSNHYFQAMFKTPKYLVCVHQHVCNLLRGSEVGRWLVKNDQFKYQLKTEEGSVERIARLVVDGLDIMVSVLRQNTPRVEHEVKWKLREQHRTEAILKEWTRCRRRESLAQLFGALDPWVGDNKGNSLKSCAGPNVLIY